MTTVGERIRIIRKSLPEKTTQEAFGKKIGVSADVITSYERGKSNPPFPTLKLIAQIYNVRIDWLLEEDGPMTMPPDEDDELIDEILAGKDEFIRTLFREIAKRPHGWAYLKELSEAVHAAMNENKTPEE